MNTGMHLNWAVTYLETKSKGGLQATITCIECGATRTLLRRNIKATAPCNHVSASARTKTYLTHEGATRSIKEWMKYDPSLKEGTIRWRLGQRAEGRFMTDTEVLYGPGEQMTAGSADFRISELVRRITKEIVTDLAHTLHDAVLASVKARMGPALAEISALLEGEIPVGSSRIVIPRIHDYKNALDTSKYLNEQDLLRAMLGEEEPGEDENAEMWDIPDAFNAREVRYNDGKKWTWAAYRDWAMGLETYPLSTHRAKFETFSQIPEVPEMQIGAESAEDSDAPGADVHEAWLTGYPTDRKQATGLLYDLYPPIYDSEYEEYIRRPWVRWNSQAGLLFAGRGAAKDEVFSSAQVGARWAPQAARTFEDYLRLTSAEGMATTRIGSQRFGTWMGHHLYDMRVRIQRGLFNHRQFNECYESFALMYFMFDYARWRRADKDRTVLMAAFDRCAELQLNLPFAGQMALVDRVDPTARVGRKELFSVMPEAAYTYLEGDLKEVGAVGWEALLDQDDSSFTWAGLDGWPKSLNHPVLIDVQNEGLVSPEMRGILREVLTICAMHGRNTDFWLEDEARELIPRLDEVSILLPWEFYSSYTDDALSGTTKSKGKDWTTTDANYTPIVSEHTPQDCEDLLN